jgi:hypothetical protein
LETGIRGPYVAPSLFRSDPGFLDCGGLTPLWIFPPTRSLPIPSSVKPEHSKTPSWPQNALGNCGTWAVPNPSRLRMQPLFPYRPNIRIMGLTPTPSGVS